MNLTNIEVYPSVFLDEYDFALKDLHELIMTNLGPGMSIQKDDLIKAQERVLILRNGIAKRLHEHSWCDVPEHQRF